MDYCRNLENRLRMRTITNGLITTICLIILLFLELF